MNRDEIDLGRVVPVFKCKGEQGCSGVNTTAITVRGCQAHYVGHFCETCADGYQMARLTTGREMFRCEKCPEVNSAWVGSLVVLVGALVIVTQTKRLVEKVVGKDPQVLVIMAVMRSLQNGWDDNSSWKPMQYLQDFRFLTAFLGACRHSSQQRNCEAARNFRKDLVGARAATPQFRLR